MESFKYDPIDLEGPAFRLLRLLRGEGFVRCELYQARLHQTFPYEALSYTWGSKREMKNIEVNGRRLDITRNLHEALYHLRSRDRNRILWVDAICIDQGNTKERGHQVQQMGEIYKQADRVIFWLGPATADTEFVMDSIRLLQKKSIKHAFRNWKLADERWVDLWATFQPILRRRDSDSAYRLRNGLQSLLRRPWFRRVWILQEVANAKAAWVCCGPNYVQAHVFTLAPLLLGVRPDPHCHAVLDIMPGPSRRDSWWSQSQDLYTLLSNFGGCEATDPRDIIYALLGISSDAKDSDILRPDYGKSALELTRDLIRFLYFCEIDSVSARHLGTIRDVVLQLRPLNKIALSKLIVLSHKENIAAILRRVDFEITGEVVGPEAEYDTIREVIELLHHHQGKEIRVAAEVVDDAAKYLSKGKRVMELSLHLGDEVKGCEAVAKLLLDGTANTGARDRYNDGRAPLSLAVERGYEAVVKLLFAIGADIEAQDCYNNGQIPLSLAVKGGHEAVVKLLLKKGANIEAKDRYNTGRTPLSLAAERGHEAVVKLLHVNGADVETQNLDYPGRTPLSYAAENGHESVVKLLLERGANIEGKDRYDDGRTPLSLAAERGHEAVVKLLLVNGANIEAKNLDYPRRTPLSYATKNGHGAVVKLLLKKGANIEAKDRYDAGRTPLSLAAESGHEAAVKLLIGKGANVTAQDRYESRDLMVRMWLITIPFVGWQHTSVQGTEFEV
jgi:ankyrin repeat protein